MNSLTIFDQNINMIDGLFSLNDLHKASGGKAKHKPAFFLRNEETKALIAEIEKENYELQICNSKKIAVKIIQGKGKQQGTYVCKELVYRYAMWISPKFSLMVIRALDKMLQDKLFDENYQLIAQFERACIEFEHLTQLASNAGRTLCVVGKRLKPNAQQKVLSLQNKIQPQLALGENHHE